jgi:hypothetical protein
VSTIKEKLDSVSKESRRKKKEELEKELKEKSTKVQEKIKRGEKLTTQDLLVFQGTAAKDELSEDKAEGGKKKITDSCIFLSNLFFDVGKSVPKVL